MKFELLSNWGEEENVMKTTFEAWKTTAKEQEGYEGAGGAPEQEGAEIGRQAPFTTPEKERKGAPPDLLSVGGGSPIITPLRGGGVTLKPTSIWDYFPKRGEDVIASAGTGLASLANTF